MSKIADPLREYIAKTWDGSMYVNQVPMRLLEIADQIDAEHERLMVEALRHECSLAHKVTHGTGEYGHTTCSACGVTVHRRDKWCWSCGARLHGEVAEKRKMKITIDNTNKLL